MNGLSLISFFNGYSFIILGIYILKLNYKETLNRLAAIVNFCFAIWALAYTFFYTSATVNSAMVWYRIASFGWIGFCVFATHFFLILSEKNKKWKGLRLYIVLYALPVILFLQTLFSSDGSVVKGLVQSKIGWGWAYYLDIKSIWYWVYVFYLLVYFLFALYFTYAWAKKSNRIRFLKQAKSIILLDIAMIIIGFCTDIILPAISSIIPPVFNLISIVWGIGFFYIVKTFKLMSVYDAASPDLILKTVMDPIIMLDSKGIIITCNEATKDLFKYDLDHIINKPLSDFCKSKEYGEQKISRVFNEKVVRNIEIDLVDSEGNIINALASSSVAESKLDGLVGVVLNIHDITRLKKIEKELYKRKEKYKKLSKHLDRLANYDKLTDLPNRRLFFDKLELAIKNYNVSGRKFALIFIDLDGFKAINDSYGHDIGDLVLMNVSNRFVASIRKKDVIARVGGDEFVIIISNLQQDLEVDVTIEKIRKMFFAPIVINNNSCPIGISFGISKCPEDGVTTDELVKAADQRMYRHKVSKKG